MWVQAYQPADTIAAFGLGGIGLLLWFGGAGIVHSRVIRGRVVEQVSIRQHKGENAMSDYDLAIRGGSVIDGSGGLGFLIPAGKRTMTLAKRVFVTGRRWYETTT